MSGYACTHAVIAGTCAFLAVVFVTLSRLVPHERAVHRWLAASYAGAFALALGCAGGSELGGFGGMRAPWAVAGIAGGGLLLCGSLLSGWTMLGRRMPVVAQAILAASASLYVFRLLEVGGRAISDPAAVTWESLTYGTITASPAKSMFVISTSFLLVLSVLAIRRRDRLGWSTLAAAAPALPICLYESLRTSGRIDGPSLAGIAGLPFLFAASVTVPSRYASMRDAWEREAQYRLVRRLGAGGMGELWLAMKQGPGGFERHVALKRVLCDACDFDAIERLLAEARVAAKLSHPNIVAVNGVARLDDGWYIEMEHLDGDDLRAVMKAAGESLPIADAVRICEQVARGLAAAHKAGVVHHDVSPHNVMITYDGAVKLVDFGIAASPRPGSFFGKVAYAAPEKLRCGEVDARADVFSLGVVLYEAIAGVRPFRGPTRYEIAESILRGRYAPLECVREAVPDAVADIVRTALAPSPDARFRSAAEMADALAAAAAGLDAARPVESTRPHDEITAPIAPVF